MKKRLVATMALPTIMVLMPSTLFDANGSRWAQAQTVSTSVVGFIDKIKRQDDGQLLIIGWGLDIHGNGAPVWLVSIYDGQIIFTGTTSGARADITKAYPGAITDNVVIKGLGIPIDCRPGQKIITLAVSARHQVAIIGRSDIEGCP
jgi:hypothetical protein